MIEDAISELLQIFPPLLLNELSRGNDLGSERCSASCLVLNFELVVLYSLSCLVSNFLAKATCSVSSFSILFTHMVFHTDK